MSAEFFGQYYRKTKNEVPSLHVVLGSGLSASFDEIDVSARWEASGNLNFSEVPGLPASGVQGHPGEYRFYRDKQRGKTLCLQAGRIHGYEGHSARDAVKPVMFPRMAGCTRFLLTNAAGSLHKEYQPGSLMLINDHVNMTGSNPLYGPNPTNAQGKPLGPRFPDLSEAYDREMRGLLKKTCQAHRMTIHEGTYLGLSGPTFETPSEVRLYASWGLGAVGMSTVWECIALKHSGAKVAGLSIISNLGCGLSDQPLSHAEVEEIGRKIGRALLETIFDYATHYTV